MVRSQRTTQHATQQIQHLLQLFNHKQLDAAIALAKDILKLNSKIAVVQSILASALALQNKDQEALPFFENAAQLEPQIAEHHFNLALAFTGLGRHQDAIRAYEKSIKLKPEFTVAYFNMGVAHLACDDLAEAMQCFNHAIRLQPGYTEAWGNLGVAQQRSGMLSDAILSYEKAISIEPKAQLHLSLGSALHNQGKLSAAIEQYQSALQLAPHSAEAHDKLGTALWAQGKVDAALQAHHHALSLNKDFADAHYHLGVIFQEAKGYDRAFSHFESSKIHDWKARCLYCLYKSKQYAAFNTRLSQSLDHPHSDPFVATLTAHYAANFGTPDPYTFCPNPMDFVYHGHIPELDPSVAGLNEQLLNDILKTDISERKQGRLYEGVQSAGNLFRRQESSFQQLAACILKQVHQYKEAFAQADCTLIQQFPEDLKFTSAWFIKMRKGGHLTSHIHEEGWISGSVYLAMPDVPEGRLDGSIEFSMDGDDYPIESASFSVKVIRPQVGDIVLFPSSLFHRTLPFNSDQDRICIAFDIRPAPPSSAHFSR